ncbi:hypothetical protein [Chromobacterium subtsugae]|uniref:hypothetical protein n=1 Tax=Chromobacterium subtsugae TaxID=251747 RepID=UPI0007F8D4A0|nr:hypothetical protein [Chromobacterium subtsugae]OBU85508.1 hypothetical protein MY55_16180 [Chromobacterium subtsugae]
MIDIDAIIDSMGWSLTDSDWVAMRRLCQATLAAAAAAESAAASRLGLEWRACVKRPVVVHVRKQREGEKHVGTREGITPLRPDDLIMRGIAGEEYPIGSELWAKTYWLEADANLPNEKAIGKESLQVQAVPDGWRLVPIKPTEEMIRKSYWSGAGEINIHEEWAKREVWGRMLAAAPSPN